MQFQHSVAILPSSICTNGDLEQILSRERIGQSDAVCGLDRIGGVWARRHYHSDHASREVTPLSASAIEALRRAEAPVDAAAVFVHMSTTPDGISPATAHRVHRAARLPQDCASFDLSSSCSSFLSSVRFLDPWVRHTGHRALVVVAEQKSRHLDPTDRRTSALFGDGAFAALTRPAPKATERPVLWAQPIVRSDLVGNIKVCREGEQDFLRMEQPRLMYRETISALHTMVERLCSLAQEHHQAIRRIYVHQANAHLLADVKERLPDSLAMRMPVLMSDVGNLVAASLPVHRLRCVVLEQLFRGLCALNRSGLACERPALLSYLQNDAVDLQPWIRVVCSKGSVILHTSWRGEQISVVDSSTESVERSWLGQISTSEWLAFFRGLVATGIDEWSGPAHSEFGNETVSVGSQNSVDAWVVAGGGFQCLGCLVPL
jgi:3-oxoacyl-[acyl-carrier-protein] synthase III